MQAPYSMSRSNGTTTPLEESKEWLLEASSWYVQPSHTWWRETIWFERPRQSQVDLALDNWCLTAEKKKRNMLQLRKIMFWRKEELSCFAFLALYVKGHARFKVMIPMMVLFRFQGLSGWQLWFSCVLPFWGPFGQLLFLLYFSTSPYIALREIYCFACGHWFRFPGLLGERNVKQPTMAWNI